MAHRRSPRWWWLLLAVPVLVVGYLGAVALLVGVEALPWIVLLFPLWVLLVSVQILLAGTRALTAQA